MCNAQSDKIVWELQCSMISQLNPILHINGHCCAHIRLRKWEGWSWAALSAYTILLSVQRIWVHLLISVQCSSLVIFCYTVLIWQMTNVAFVALRVGTQNGLRIRQVLQSPREVSLDLNYRPLRIMPRSSADWLSHFSGIKSILKILNRIPLEIYPTMARYKFQV